MNSVFFGPFCAFMSSVTWALGSAGYSRLAKEYSPFSVNFSRSLIALPLFLVAVAVGGLAAVQAVELRHLGWFSLSMLASYALGDSLFLFSSQAIGVPAALTIASAYPLLTAAWGCLVQGEHLDLLQILGLCLTVGGVAIVILSAPRIQGAAAGLRIGKTAGIFCAIGAAFCWAINSYSVMRGGQDLSPAVGNAIRMAVALILCALIGKLFQSKASLFLPFREYRKWLWLFLIEAFGGSYFFLYGLSHSSLAVGSTLASVAPVISVPVSLALGLEAFSWRRTAGVFIVVLGIWLLVGTLNT